MVCSVQDLHDERASAQRARPRSVAVPGKWRLRSCSSRGRERVARGWRRDEDQ